MEFDPKDRVNVTDVRKKGEWYTIKGKADGREASVDVHAKHFEGQGGAALARRSLLGVKEQESRK